MLEIECLLGHNMYLGRQPVYERKACVLKNTCVLWDSIRGLSLCGFYHVCWGLPMC